MGRALFARGFVERLAPARAFCAEVAATSLQKMRPSRRLPRYWLRRSPARDAKIAPAQMVPPDNILL
jgi:hypothetical protein